MSNFLKSETYYSFLSDAYERVKRGETTWVCIKNEFEELFPEKITDSAIRHRAERFVNSKSRNTIKEEKNVVKSSEASQNSFLQYNADGSIESRKIIDCPDEIVNDPKTLLEYLGYDSNKWQLMTYRISRWENGSDRVLKSVQFKVCPTSSITIGDMIESAKKAFNEEITPIRVKDKDNFDGMYNCDRLMEIAPVELHLGKLSNEIETGENYDLKIAQKRFYDIFEEIIRKQKIERCERALLIIGSDFFNSESDGATSVNKIPQQNDTRYIKLFTEGIKMYTTALLSLRENFKEIDVMLCAGNHARAMETFLYIALAQRFIWDSKIKFIENYRQTQAYTFGNCAIFYNHGDSNLKQLIKSIPAEFASIWGEKPYRELHLGHLHKEVTVDDNGGMITRRIGSPCGTDAWHYSNRFVGAVKKHQIFVWDYNAGLKEVFYIPVK